uniref:Sepiapterin reductase n=1 Tax=Strigamia maritima TaxID=126957 RepID=T1JCW4_STRMM
MATGLKTYGRVFCLISGASRGLGRGLAVKLADRLDAGSVLFLLARNTLDLVQVQETIGQKQRDIKVVIKCVDLTNADHEAFKAAIGNALDESQTTAERFDTALLIHNAGSLGDIAKTTLALRDVGELRNYYDLNLFSPILLNSAFFNIFSSECVKKQVVVNVSSLAAIQPFKTWSYYCVGKAARDMFFRVMAAEFPRVRVLNYSPGPLKTEMTVKAREETLDEDVREWFKGNYSDFEDGLIAMYVRVAFSPFLSDAYREDKMLDVNFTVERLFAILEADNFKSGDHVDVFDDLSG